MRVFPNLFIFVALTAGCGGKDGADGEAGAMGTTGTSGTNGTNGTNGLDGQLRIYGDESAGPKVVAANEAFLDVNTQYSDFTINAGITLVVPSGTVIRCTGTFTNNGTITVATSASGGSIFGTPPSQGLGVQLADNGHTSRPPGHGDLGDNSVARFGGSNGSGVNVANAHHIYAVGFRGGSGGMGGLSIGGAGGGTLTVLAEVAVINTGVINANGQAATGPGAGGGGGGIVILASNTSVSNTGTINATGGNGASNDNQFGIGGGGGGGIIRLIGPTATSAGNLVVTGGTAGTANGTVTGGFHGGGGGGGGCGGAGGVGGGVLANNTPQAAGAGVVGHALIDVLNPTAYFP